MSRPDPLLEAIDGVQEQCGDIVGAVLATAEGLVLAARGSLAGDVPAATATHLADLLERDLSVLLGASCHEALFWSGDGLWGVARLPSRHVVLAHGKAPCAAGTLRLALGRLKRDLGPALAELEAPAPHATDLPDGEGH